MARARRRRDSDDVWGATMFSPFIDVVMNGFAAIVVILCLFILFSDQPTTPIRFVATLSGPLRLVADASFAHVLSVTGGSGARRFSLTERDGSPPPEWMTLDPLGIAFGNAKARVDPLRLTATVSDRTGTDRMDFEVEVLPGAIPWTHDQPVALTLAATDLPPARVGLPYEIVLGALGGVPPLQWKVTPARSPSDPVKVRAPGVEVEAKSTAGERILLGGQDTGLWFAAGRISGTPIVAGRVTLDVEVSHSDGHWRYGEVDRVWKGGQAARGYSITVLGAVSLAIETTPARERDPLLVAARASALRPEEIIRWSGLPDGMTPRDDGRVVTGSMAKAGRYPVRVEVVAGDSVLAHAEGDLVVLPRVGGDVDPIVFQAWVGEDCNYAVPYRGRLEPVSVTLASGRLPDRVDLVDGAFRGRPTETGLFAVSLKLEDAAGVTTTLAVTLRVGTRY